MMPPTATDIAEHSQLTAVEHRQKNKKSADHMTELMCPQDSDFREQTNFCRETSRTGKSNIMLHTTH